MSDDYLPPRLPAAQSLSHESEAQGTSSPVIQPFIDDATKAQAAADAERRARRRRMSPEHIRQRKRRRMRRRILIGVCCLIAVILACIVWLMVSAWKAKAEVEAIMQSSSFIQDSVKSGDEKRLAAQLDALSEHIDAAYDQTKQPVWALASLIPYYGSDVQAVRDVVEIMEDVSNNALPKLSDACAELDLNEIGIENGTVQLGGMTDVAGKVTAANAIIADANINLSNIGGTHIEPLTSALTQAQQKFNDLAQMMDTANRVVNLLPTMFDVASNQIADGVSRSYLIMVQNNSELRATGGIPGSWGVLTVTDGHLSIDDFKSVNGYWNSPVTPLTAEEKSLFTDKLVRFQQDVNFTPDFSRSGEIAVAMWQDLYGQTVDGVISVDPVFLQNVLKVTGQVTLDDGTVLSGDNAAQILLNQTYFDKATQDEQNAFFSSTAAAAFAHLVSSSGVGRVGLISAIADSVNNGHMYVWSAHEDEQAYLSGTALAGELETNPSKPVVGVYFNDATMGKMDWYLKRDITYEYDKSYPNGAAQYTVNVTLTNTLDAQTAAALPELIRGYEEGDSSKPRNGEISTIVYAYAPAGGRLVDWNFTGSVADMDFDTVTVHDGLTVGAKSVLLQPGESMTLTMHMLTSVVGGNNALILRTTPDADE